MFHSDVMQSVEGLPLDRCQGWQGGRTGSRGCADDTSTGAIDEDSAREVVREGDGAGVEGPRWRRALRRDVSAQTIILGSQRSFESTCCVWWVVAKKPHLTMIQSRHRACASSGWESASSLYTTVESAR